MYRKAASVAIVLLVFLGVTSSSIITKPTSLFSNGVSGIIVSPRNSPHAKVVSFKDKNIYNAELQKLITRYRQAGSFPSPRQAGGVTRTLATTALAAATTSASTATSTTATQTVSPFEQEILDLLQQLQAMGNPPPTTSTSLPHDHHHHYYGYNHGHPIPSQGSSYSSSNQGVDVLGYVDNSGNTHYVGNSGGESSFLQGILQYLSKLPGYTPSKGGQSSSYGSNANSNNYINGAVNLGGGYGVPTQTYGPPKAPTHTYGPPKAPTLSYGPPPKAPTPTYGPPPNAYLAPKAPAYGPPKAPAYGPPKAPAPAYGPPKPTYGPQPEYNYYPLSENVHGVVLPPIQLHGHQSGGSGGYAQQSGGSGGYGQHSGGSYHHQPHYHIPSYPTHQPTPTGSGIIVTQVISGQYGLTTKTFTAMLTPAAGGPTTYIFTSTFPAKEAVTTLIAAHNQGGSTAMPTVTTIFVTTTPTTGTTSTTATGTTTTTTTAGSAVTLTQTGTSGSPSTIIITSPIQGRNKPVIESKNQQKDNKQKPDKLGKTPSLKRTTQMSKFV